MRDVLAKYIVVAHVAVLAAFLAWVHGGTRADHLTAIPWLSLAVLEMVLILPPPRRDETLDQSRRRVWRKIIWDPLLYIGLALCAYLLFQGMNGGRALAFDAESNVWSFLPPPVGWGPFCVAPDEAMQMLVWFVPACAAVLGIRHGMNRRGKLVLLRVLVFNGAVLSIFGIIQRLSGTQSLFWMTPLDAPFFASFGYLGHAGAFFTLLFAINGGLLIQAILAEDAWRLAVWLAVALLLNLLGALLSFSTPAIVTSLGLLLVGGLYAMRHGWNRVDSGVRFKAVTAYVAALLLGGLFLFFAMPDNPVLQRLLALEWPRLSAGSETVTRWTAAWNIWKDYPWFGVGGWGFRHYVGLYLNEAQRAQLHAGAANLGCDPLQFLVEHGAVGAGLMLGALGVLVTPIIRRLWISRAATADGRTGERWLLFRISPVCVSLLAACILVFGFSLVDMPFRSPAVLVLWAVALACAPAFLPAHRTPDAAPVARGRGGQAAAPVDDVR